MLKKIMFAAVATGLVAAVALPITQVEAAGPLTCKEAAKLKYPADHAARSAYKKGCKAVWKAAHKGAVKSA
ncbi:MAG TPA: hypothetical protein DD732_02000 [Rhizobiales bacterium]|jgi:predicted cobalt transporter CbtA|nr:hypothetical protein [Hyphomicrobiales bacterium]HBR25805.1 hypothetical protein [Hyphomicrobiales bacterium]